jgi:DNA-binding transcriptional MerR regulator
MRAITSSRADGFPIGELSKHSGVNIETIRYYERIKMLRAPPRTASGRRVYGATDLRILAFIRRSRELGFSLDEIRALLRLERPARHPAARLKRSPPITSKTSGRRCPILRSSNVCWRKRFPDVRETELRIAPYWTFSIFSDPNSRPRGLGRDRQ